MRKIGIKLIGFMPKTNVGLFAVVCCISCCPRGAYADDVADIIAKKQAQVIELQNEIDRTNREIVECNRQKKNWGVAAVVGGIGTAGTLAGAVFQGVKLNKLKKSGATDATNDGGEQ